MLHLHTPSSFINPDSSKSEVDYWFTNCFCWTPFITCLVGFIQDKSLIFFFLICIFLASSQDDIVFSDGYTRWLLMFVGSKLIKFKPFELATINSVSWILDNTKHATKKKATNNCWRRRSITKWYRRAATRDGRPEYPTVRHTKLSGRPVGSTTREAVAGRRHVIPYFIKMSY